MTRPTPDQWSQEAESVIRHAYRLIADEWVGSNGPIGEGAEWMAAAERLLPDLGAPWRYDADNPPPMPPPPEREDWQGCGR